ncbi:hypothetical protein CL634_05050 [bacterium]|nr:hypothetical protein [bacterium]|tara:strand:- start:256 stop:1377 length:1122 start_codon:yes stop_codon:yes gene_type:complete
MRSKYLLLLVLLIWLVPTFIFAQEETTGETVSDEIVSAEELGVRAPALSASNKLTWLKNIWEKLRLAATTDPEQKIELQLQFANQRLLAIRQANENGDLDNENLQKALDKFEERLNAAKERLAEVRESDEETFDRLSQRFTDGELSRQRLLKRLRDARNSGEIEDARQRALDRLRDVLHNIDPDDLEKRFAEASERGLALVRRLQNLEVLKELEARLPDSAAEALRAARELKLERFQNEASLLPTDAREGEAQRVLEYVRDGEISNPIIDRITDDLIGTPAELRERIQKLRRVRDQKEEELISDCVCSLHYQPVCGVDGNTYGNSCQAGCSEVEIIYAGECQAGSDESPGDLGDIDQADEGREPRELRQLLIE